MILFARLEKLVQCSLIKIHSIGSTQKKKKNNIQILLCLCVGFFPILFARKKKRLTDGWFISFERESQFDCMRNTRFSSTILFVPISNLSDKYWKTAWNLRSNFAIFYLYAPFSNGRNILLSLVKSFREIWFHIECEEKKKIRTSKMTHDASHALYKSMNLLKSAKRFYTQSTNAPIRTTMEIKYLIIERNSAECVFLMAFWGEKPTTCKWKRPRIRYTRRWNFQSIWLKEKMLVALLAM